MVPYGPFFILAGRWIGHTSCIYPGLKKLKRGGWHQKSWYTSNIVLKNRVKLREYLVRITRGASPRRADACLGAADARTCNYRGCIIMGSCQKQVYLARLGPKTGTY